MGPFKEAGKRGSVHLDLRRTLRVERSQLGTLIISLTFLGLAFRFSFTVNGATI